uniref:Uncharacterized protein n=1 Tax=Schistosoma haematobium TaxID=6185 RepID=A0A094ZVQ1_SCHHA
MSQEVWRNKTESISSLDRLARNTLTMDLPEARSCREAREQSRKEMHVLNEKLASQLEKSAIDQSLIDIYAYCAYYFDIALIHKYYKKRWIVANSGIQFDVRFVLFETRHLDVPISQSF